MATVNKLAVLGRLGKDIELKQGNGGGQAYADFTVATDEYDGKKDGKAVYKTQWFNCRAFGQQAEYASKFGKKGNTVYVEGSHTSNENNGKVYWTVKVNTFVIAGSNGNGSSNGGASSGSEESQPANEPATQSAPAASAQAATAKKPAASVPVTPAAEEAAADDDLPF